MSLVYLSYLIYQALTVEQEKHATWKDLIYAGLKTGEIAQMKHALLTWSVQVLTHHNQINLNSF